MAFSINQVRHLFVASDPKTANAAVTDLGDTSACGVAGQSLYFKHFGHGGVICSDKIAVENILYAKLSAGASLNTPLYKNTLTVSTAVAGQVYTVKVLCEEFVGGVQDQRTVVAAYTSADTTAANVAKGLRVALRKALGFQVADSFSSEASSADAGNIDNYKEALFTVTGSSTSVVISEVAPYWELGKFPAGKVVRIPQNGVTLCDIINSGNPTNLWGSVVYATNGNAGDAMKKLADLEYFCLGARGDEYRGMGYPYNIETKGEVVVTNNYDVIDIHYAYVGSNESVQKSEKDITILVPKDNTAFAQSIDSITGFAEGDPRKLVPAGSGNGA